MCLLQRALCALAALAALEAWCGMPEDTVTLAGVERLQAELQALRARTDDLQRELDALRRVASPAHAPDGAVELRLSQDVLPAMPGTPDAGGHVLARPWWNNLDVYGFAAAGFYDTGPAGTREHGGFEIREATLFVEADVWTDVSVFMELQTNRLDADDTKFVRTAEMYLWMRELDLFGAFPIGVKLGRFDIPFGEEYLTQDAIDNPLISTSAAYPYGWDEGVLLYGGDERLAWVVAVTDGTDTRSRDDNGEKAVNLKLSGQLGDSVHAALSLMRNGGSGESALEFGGSHVEPIGRAGASALGRSASERVDARFGQLDVKVDFRWMQLPATLSLSYGEARLDDEDSRFDRDLRWYSVEPHVRIDHEWYVVGRYSEIGTDDADEGFHLDGKTFAGGSAAFGDDANRLRRWGAGIGWRPNERVRMKLEVGADAYRIIDASSLRARNGDRRFVGLEAAARF